MTSSSTKHYSLTKGQRDILILLYTFRFATSKQIGQVFHISKRTINKRLLLMTELGYIGRKYESEYRLQGKLATYYLLPKGIDALKALDSDKYSARVLRNMRKDVQASDQFIEQSLALFDIYCQLHAKYGDSILFLTKSQLAHKYEYFDDFTPSVYLQIHTSGEDHDYFLEFMQSSKPYFAIQKRIREYIDYADSGEWETGTNSEFPVVLFVCDTKQLRGRLLRRAEQLVGDAADMRCYIAAMDGLDSWRDLEDPDAEPLTLDMIPRRA